MNAPKKPGTDLSALKARLAKKDAPASEPAAPAAAAAAAPKAPARPPFAKKAPPPAGDLPAPGEQAAIPPPGEVVLDIPAPGEVALPPQPAAVAAAQAAAPAAPAARKSIEDGTPFGSTAGSFDPNAGIIADAGGEVAQKGNRGLIVLASAAALAFGVTIGWISHQIMSKGDLKAQAQKKGEAMLAEATKVSEMRKGISLKLADMRKAAFTEPAKAEAELNALGEEHFKKVPNVEELFGWQLAGIGKEGIRRTFGLYEEANRLATDLRLIKNIISSNGPALVGEGAPRFFAIKFKKEGVMLVERGEPLCGEPAAPCTDPKAEPVAFNVRDSAGQPFAPAPIGKEEGQVLPLPPEGQIYTLAIGLKPESNARAFVELQFQQIEGHLAEMAKAETRAIKALQSYSSDPNVDGSGPADPGAD